MFWRSVFDLLGLPGCSTSSSSATDIPVVNPPATGLTMLGDSIGTVDVGGSPYGTDIHHSSMDSFCSIDSNPWE
jgi:hypothetical protein